MDEGRRLKAEADQKREIAILAQNKLERLEGEVEALEKTLEARIAEMRQAEFERNRARRELREAGDALQRFALGLPRGCWVENT